MQKEEFSFELLAQENKARLGKISTPRGKIDTPSFNYLPKVSAS